MGSLMCKAIYATKDLLADRLRGVRKADYQATVANAH